MHHEDHAKHTSVSLEGGLMKFTHSWISFSRSIGFLTGVCFITA